MSTNSLFGHSQNNGRNAKHIVWNRLVSDDSVMTTADGISTAHLRAFWLHVQISSMTLASNSSCFRTRIRSLRFEQTTNLLCVAHSLAEFYVEECRADLRDEEWLSKP